MKSPVETHYTRSNIYEAILAGLAAQGITEVTRKDLATADEFHVRGAEVSRELATAAGIKQQMHVLDAGCGIGGPARMLAGDFGCRVTGIDITAEYIRTAEKLSALVGLAGTTRFLQADALELPFPAESFDVVWTQHVQMNIAQKRRFYQEMARVLKPSGLFVYYDIFKKDQSPLYYPVPWAEDASISHLETSTAVEAILMDFGLHTEQTKDETAAGIRFLDTVLENLKQGIVSPVGIHLLIGDSAKEKLSNLYKNLSEGKIRLQSGCCRKS